MDFRYTHKLEGQIVGSFKAAASEHGALEHRAWSSCCLLCTPVPSISTPSGAWGSCTTSQVLPQGHPRTRGHRPRTLPRMVKAPAGSPRAPVAAHRKLWNLGDPQLQGCSFCSLCHHHGHRYPRRNPEHPHLSSGLPTPLHPPVPRWGGGVLGGDPHLTPGIWPCHPVLSLAPQARCSRHLCSQHHPTGWARRRAAVGPGSVSSARARGRGSRSESPDWSPGSQVGFMRTPSIQLPSGPAWPTECGGRDLWGFPTWGVRSHVGVSEHSL